jgi:response regulator RpfG family c-di-GMP phosphodiesterase
LAFHRSDEEFIEETMAHPILFVDDDAILLKSFKRTLPSQFKVVTADSPEKGLRILQEQGPFSVIVSDMKMPGMNGIEMLSQSKKISPDTIRILLTGFADQQTAIDGVNKGDLFRFLTKPCDVETLNKILRAGIRQYQFITSEKELLEQTLFGTVRVLSQMLTLINPTARGGARLKRYIRHIAKELHLEEDRWLYEIAAMLSQLGCLTIPPEVLTKYATGGTLSDSEREMVEQHPSVAAKFLMHIPRLEEVTEMISNQGKPYSQFPKCSALENYARVHLGAQILHMGLDLDRLLMIGIPPGKALLTLQKETEEYNPALVESLQSFDFGLQNMVRMKTHCIGLNTRMILDEDIFTTTGMLLASKGQQVTEAVLRSMLNYSHSVGLNEPFAVLVPLLDFEIEV